MLSIDTEIDGLYGVVLRSGRALLHNPSGQAKSKTIQGVRYDLPPASIVEIKQPGLLFYRDGRKERRGD